MAKTHLPSPEILRQLIEYEPETGRFFWKERDVSWFPDENSALAWNASRAGHEFGRRNGNVRYIATTVLKKSITMHRIAWAISYGAWPVATIDHINGDRQDNRLANLREASVKENSRNRGRYSGSSSRYKGVHYCKRSARWIAQIKIDGRGQHLGSFLSELSAAKAYDRAAVGSFGSFARPNFPCILR